MRKPILKETFVFLFIYGIVAAVCSLALGMSYFSFESQGWYLGISAFIRAFIPPFALNPLKYVLIYFSQTSFGKNILKDEELEDDLDKNAFPKNISYDQFVRLDKILSFSRNLLVVASTIAVLIIGLVSFSFHNWFSYKDIKISGIISNGCSNDWEPYVQLSEAFVLVEFYENDKVRYRADTLLREVIEIRNGQFSKEITIPKKVKKLAFKLYSKNNFEICSSRKNKIKFKDVKPGVFTKLTFNFLQTNVNVSPTKGIKPENPDESEG